MSEALEGDPARTTFQRLGAAPELANTKNAQPPPPELAEERRARRQDDCRTQLAGRENRPDVMRQKELPACRPRACARPPPPASCPHLRRDRDTSQRPTTNGSDTRSWQHDCPGVREDHLDARPAPQLVAETTRALAVHEQHASPTTTPGDGETAGSTKPVENSRGPRKARWRTRARSAHATPKHGCWRPPPIRSTPTVIHWRSSASPASSGRQPPVDEAVLEGAVEDMPTAPRVASPMVKPRERSGACTYPARSPTPDWRAPGQHSEHDAADSASQPPPTQQRGALSTFVALDLPRR